MKKLRHAVNFIENLQPVLDVLQEQHRLAKR